MIDALQEIFYTLQKNKLRTFLTAFGVFWGIFLLILLLGAGTGLERGARSEFKSSAQNSVWIWSRKTSIPYKGLAANRRIRFNQEDADLIARTIPGIQHIATENPVWGDSLVRHEKRTGNFRIFGVTDQYFKIKNALDYQGGRYLNELDQSGSRKIASIGTSVKNRLFPDKNPVGEYIEVNNIAFRIIGLFYDSDDNGQRSERIYIPMSVYQSTFGRGESYAKGIVYSPKEGVDPFELEKQVIGLLKQRHNISPDDRSAVRSFNLVKQGNKVNALLTAIKVFIWFVGIGTLTAGVVGISNIMMITVKERTTEIGIRKALGAKPSHIVSSLLFESVLVTSLAGYLGLVCGVALIELIAYSMRVLEIKATYFQQPEVNFNIALSALSILIGVGLLAGFAPAWKAARISPVEAMRAI